jgi:5-methylcytosine-specific restriction endonuclease McrA
MKTFASKSCRHCGTTYVPTGPHSVFCSRPCKNKARWTKERERRRLEGRPVGKRGGNYGRTGPDHWAYKHGIDYFKTRLSPAVRERDRTCQRCAVDLTDAPPGFWCVHHKDHDRTNQAPENLELLCKRCHQVEHRCWEKLPN